jgi:hypothetical protein
MKYKYINKEKILKVSPIMEKFEEKYIYANGQKSEFKELVIEDKPAYNEETQELYSWFENGDVITQKFKVVERDAK